AALIVAAGRGTRAGGGLPKQWRRLAGARVIDHVIRAFSLSDRTGPLCIVLHPDDMDRAEPFRKAGHLVAQGGASRAVSVQNGLDALAG
ncbi:unnamed protein product, partial [Ectocarpus sp. 12 AP-2014]